MRRVMRHPSSAQHTAGDRRTHRLIAAAAAAVVLAGTLTVARATQASAKAAGARGPVAATAAREVNLREKGQLHLVSHRNEVLQEQGGGSGTLKGHITVQLTLAFPQASVKFTAYTPGGTIVGTGEGATYASGSVAHFNGTATITGGTGKYAHASAHGIKLKGTLVKKTYAFTVEVEGKMRY
jgi:hypothetical protein